MKHQKYRDKIIKFSNEYVLEFLLFLCFDNLLNRISLVNKRFHNLAMMLIEKKINKTYNQSHIVPQLIIYFPNYAVKDVKCVDDAILIRFILSLLF